MSSKENTEDNIDARSITNVLITAVPLENKVKEKEKYFPSYIGCYFLSFFGFFGSTFLEPSSNGRTFLSTFSVTFGGLAFCGIFSLTCLSVLFITYYPACYHAALNYLKYAIKQSILEKKYRILYRTYLVL